MIKSNNSCEELKMSKGCAFQNLLLYIKNTFCSTTSLREACSPVEDKS